jgi:Nucleotidyl transferase of unknown function (DUF2204)
MPKTPTGESVSRASDPARRSESPKSFGDRCSHSSPAGLIPTIGVGISTRTCDLPNSSNVPVQPAAIELLTDLSKVLSHWGRWCVFGAQAVIAYGVPRLSADVDVTLDLVPHEPERFAREMEEAGFTLRVEDPDFVRRTRVMPFVHVATAMPLDVVLAGSGLEDEFLERARATDLGGASVPLIDPEDLMIAKVLAGRPKDIEDARGVWRLHGRALDAGRIRRILRLLEEALSQRDLLSGFESIARGREESG